MWQYLGVYVWYGTSLRGAQYSVPTLVVLGAARRESRRTPTCVCFAIKFGRRTRQRSSYLHTSVWGWWVSLNSLTDVTITTPAVGKVLIYDATNSIFENNTLTAGPNVKITEADGAITIGAGDGTELELAVRDTAVSSAGEVEGTIVKFGTTTGMTAGDVYCWNGTDWVPVDADAEATTKGLLGVALGVSSANDGLLTNGVAYLSHDPGAAGDVLYVHTTAGQVSATQPSATGDFVRVVGYCLADNKVFFSPSQDYIEIG